MDTVYPRDLFNDANLLYQLGKLYIELENNGLLKHLIRCIGSYTIHRDDTSGVTYATGIEVVTKWEMYITLYRPLNSRDKYNLYTDITGETVSVFDSEGELTDEFMKLLKSEDIL